MTQPTVLIKNGVYGKNVIVNQEFALTKPYDPGKGIVTVWGSKEQGLNVAQPRNCRIKVDSENDFEYMGDVDFTVPVMASATNPPAAPKDPIKEFLAQESEEDAMKRIGRAFDHLNMFADAAMQGTIRGLIVVGPPGIGKSHGVEEVMREGSMIGKLAGGRDKYEVIKGAISAPMLYRKMFQFKDADQVLVLDDCDISDDESLNLIKAALDSCDKRMISWFKESMWLEREGIPEKFEFEGSIIFLTNVDFANARGNKATHLNAIVSRCHYMDLEIGNQRDRLLRIKQIVGAGMLKEYGFAPQKEQEIVRYIWDHADVMRELSLRMVKKIADLVKAFPNDWEEFAISTCMLPSAKYKMLLDKKNGL